MSTGTAAPARSPSAYVPSARRRTSTTPGRQRSYTEMALARTTPVHGSMPAQRSKTPAATRYTARPTAAYTMQETRAMTPGSRVPVLSANPHVASPGPSSRPAAAARGPSVYARQPYPAGIAPGQAFNTAAVPDASGWPTRTSPSATLSPLFSAPSVALSPLIHTPSETLSPLLYTPSANLSPSFPNTGRPNVPTVPTTATASLGQMTTATAQRRLTYGDNPYTALRAAYTATKPAVPGIGSASSGVPPDAAWPASAGLSGRFQDPGDDWVSSYEFSSGDVIRELQRVLAGLSRLSGLAPAPMEARAPPRQLPTTQDLPTASSRPSATHAQPLSTGHSVADQPSHRFDGSSSNMADAARQEHAQVAAHRGSGTDDRAAKDVLVPYPRHAWAERDSALSQTPSPPPAAAPAPGPAAVLGSPSEGQLWTALSALLTTGLPAADPLGPAPIVQMDATGTTNTDPAANAAAAAATAGVSEPRPVLPLAYQAPHQDSTRPGQQAAAGAVAEGLSGSPADAPAAQPTPGGSVQVASEAAVQPADAAAPDRSLGAASSVAPAGLPAGLPSNVLTELFSVVQACNQTTSRLLADLAAARKEAEVAKERAEEADSLARAFQQQLILRQRSVAAWQTALVEMEEREALARKQLQELQERCAEQEKRAEQAEHVAATAQLRLERLIATQRAGQSEVDTSTGSSSPPEQVGNLRADLAAAKTWATRVELELAMARNKALIAQQELSAEEERARRAAAAAAVARQELGRTRAALEIMSVDHDRLQTQLVDLRGKIGDAAEGWLSSSSRADLFGPNDKRQQTQQRPPSSQPAGSVPSPLTQHASSNPREGAQGLAPSYSITASTAAGAAGAGAGAGADSPNMDSPNPGGLTRDMHTASPGEGGAGEGGKLSHRPSLISTRSSAARSGSSGKNSSGGGSRSSSPSRPRNRSGSSAQRRRGGSLLLVPPCEMPADTCASVRYGQCMALRRQSRSQDTGLLESPSGGDDEPDGLMVGRGASGRTRSPRAMSGSHDGVVRRQHTVGIDDGDGAARAAAPPSVKATGVGCNDDGDVDREGAGGAAGLRNAGSMHRGGGVTEEMLPLNRTPSSGVRRRLPTLQTSQGSQGRDVQLSLAPPQQQHNRSREGSVNLSLSDLRRQMAAATAAAAAAAGAAPDAPQTAQRQQTAADGLTGRTTMTKATTIAVAPAAAAKAHTGAPAAAAAAVVGKDRSSSSQMPKQLEQQREQQQPTPQLRAHQSQATCGSPTASTTTTLSSSEASKARSALPDLRPPPLEQSNSPPDYPRHIINAASARGASSSHGSAAPTPGAAPQMGLREAVVAAAGVPTLLLTNPSYRPQAGTVATMTQPSRLGRTATVDTRPPQGYNTSHINDLYESMQSRGSWGLPADAHGLVSHARSSFLPPPPQPQQALRGGAREQHGTLGARWQTGADSSAMTTDPLPHAPIAYKTAAAHAGMPPRELAFTSRTRMLFPGQLDSYLVSPSVTSSMAAEASFEGSLPAASTAQPWQQQQQPTPAQQQLLRAAGTSKAAAESHSREEARAPGVPEAPRESPTGRHRSVGLESRRHLLGGVALWDADASGSESGRAASRSPRQPRRPWWQWILRRHNRRAKGHSPGRGRPVPSVTGTAGWGSDGGAAATAAGPDFRKLEAAEYKHTVHMDTAKITVNRAPADQLGAGEGAHKNSSAGRSLAHGRSSSGGGAGKGKGRFIWSALLHFGMWSGGMAVGVALVLGAASFVEGTLGIGARKGAALAVTPAGDDDEMCGGCAAPQPPKNDYQERAKAPRE
ncbi:hypothetical protein VOLCADRAFT_91066 [Volvox carteri f. nagariensis]|uniref:Uncharacterized protein n=1 Tax=Volvox carteri f. nagariensis TaxID=3068 RepID=D8TW32_VOLCA|nr:uncharacterized protein VOLCADRAFT_91066 [Volvox carteri f. nagariensis]EFJ48409.1 hypothetical protein VOLCADRAFT_91066 [Volvox carteri f. nagariensis]|eukprot:XP_002950663.1 hypothetical protein VOLCADRAFT_91066 [Volvox carteri f. nagariensis]